MSYNPIRINIVKAALKENVKTNDPSTIWVHLTKKYTDSENFLCRVSEAGCLNRTKAEPKNKKTVFLAGMKT